MPSSEERLTHDDNHAVLGQMLPVPQNDAAHIAHAGAVHHDLAGGNRPSQLAGLGACTR